MPSCRAVVWMIVGFLLLSVTRENLLAQDPAAEPEQGWSFLSRFQGSSNTLGQVYRLDAAARYDFNRYFSVAAGLPFYFVSASGDSSTGSLNSGSGLGNAYLVLRLAVQNPAVNYSSTLTGTAPTGDASKGFSTGRATIDWSHHFDRSFGRTTPFAIVGIANTVSDTDFFTRPYSTLGWVGHFEGGLYYALAPRVSAGASAYAITPTGDQKVFSRVIARQEGISPVEPPPFSPVRTPRGGFETESLTEGSAEIARDNGFSAWLGANLSRHLGVGIGFTRSVPFDLNTFSFGVGINVGHIVRKGRGR